MISYDTEAFRANQNARGSGRWCLRYIKTAPLDDRPHEPCEPMFFDYVDADDHLEKQPNKALLEVVQR